MDQAHENFVAEALKYEVAMRNTEGVFFDIEKIAFRKYWRDRLEVAAAAVKANLPPPERQEPPEVVLG